MADVPKLIDQRVVQAPIEDKIRLSLLATALVDALGGPVEFHRRFTFPLTTSLSPNRNFPGHGVLAPGTWTDDTSMTLCLARSIAKKGFDEADQLKAYANWYRKGELSAIGVCFDIGRTIHTAVEIYLSSDSPKAALDAVGTQLAASHNAGNGSLMRILPVGLAYWKDPVTAKAYARKSSATTHPTPVCLEACAVWTEAIVTILQQSSNEHTTYSKLDLLTFFTHYPYETDALRSALTVPATAPSFIEGPDADLEAYYQRYHPILRLVVATASASTQDKRATQSTRPDFPYSLPSAKDVPSSGYVLHTLVAALYCLFATDTFEAGAIMAVNLGDDADTVGAVYAGIAGCWYAKSDSESAHSEGTRHLFWSEKVREWKAGLVRRDLVDQVAEELVLFQNGPSP